jgi:hypothetical protein
MGESELLFMCVSPRECPKTRLWSPVGLDNLDRSRPGDHGRRHEADEKPMLDHARNRCEPRG